MVIMIAVIAIVVVVVCAPLLIGAADQVGADGAPQ